MVVVKINIIGPTRASEELIINAFSTVLNLNIIIAANISILPDNNRKNAIPKTAFSKIINIATSRKYPFHYSICGYFVEKDRFFIKMRSQK
jgi:hypothetical protein